MSTLCPWNFPSYVPANGFHPIYRSLFENNYANGYCFDLLKVEQLLNSPLNEGKAIRKEADAFRRRYLAKHQMTPLCGRFLELLNPDLQALSSMVFADFEFHHTLPLSGLERPFIFHCESFLPIFMPFAFQGGGTISRPEDVRKWYRSIFESDMCLEIWSHLQITLDQFSAFFKSAKIDAKLRLSGMGLADVTSNTLRMDHRQRDWAQPTFLFSHSLHQNPNSLASRGLFTTIAFAQQWIQARSGGRFIFRCPRISAKTASEHGINLNRFFQEGGDRIIWMPGYLSEDAQLRLFSLADVVLLPSLNLHSATIMQAMWSGAVPVVTDTLGTDLYIEDQTDGIILKGVRTTVWTENPETNVWTDDHAKSSEAQINILQQMKKRLLVELPNADQWQRMSQKAIQKAEKIFSGTSFRASMNFNPKKISTKTKQEQIVTTSLLQPEAIIPVSPKMFAEHASTVVKVTSHNVQLFCSNGILTAWPRSAKRSIQATDLPPTRSPEGLPPLYCRSSKIDELSESLFPIVEMPPEELQPPAPVIISSRWNHNIIIYNKKYYAIPVLLGKIDFINHRVGDIPGVISCRSLNRIWIKLWLRKKRNSLLKRIGVTVHEYPKVHGSISLTMLSWNGKSYVVKNYQGINYFFKNPIDTDTEAIGSILKGSAQGLAAKRFLTFTKNKR